MSTILVVDDERNIRELVGLYLTAAGFTVEHAEDGAQALEMFRSHRPALVVLDLMLPGMDGADVCRAIRAEATTPIIMLTARDEDIDKVSLLEAGADDYVVKPFSPPEMVARVRAILRRVQPPEDEVSCEVVNVGGMMLDAASREVTVDGVRVSLTAREFDLLFAMASEPGVVFSRERLLERAVGFADFVDVRGVDVHIRHLREKLGDDAGTPRFIETVRGVGYRVRRDAS